jgi:hypothetical protein
MKRHQTVRLSEEVVEMFDKLTISRSAAIEAAVRNARTDPELLVRGLKHRMRNPRGANSIKVGYSRDSDIDEPVEQLVEMTKLPAEEVIRLCMEAYIHRL